MRTTRVLIHVAASAALAMLTVLGVGAEPAMASGPTQPGGTGIVVVRQDVAVAASPPWEVLRTQYLSGFPGESLPTDCVSGRWLLGSGTYTWGHMFTPASNPNFTYMQPEWLNLNLGAGAYTMQTCLDPRNGYYTQRTSLDPDNPALQTINIESDWIINDGSATWTWGAYLQPNF